MQMHAVAALSRAHDGQLIHRLHLLEALTADHAEAKVLTEIIDLGQSLVSMIRLSADEVAEAA